MRKIQLFSDMLLTDAHGSQDKVKETSVKINRFAADLSAMIQSLTDFSGLNLSEKSFEMTDLNEILVNVTDRLNLHIIEKNATLSCDVLHSIKAIPGQMARLFFHLISNSLKYAKADKQPAIRIYSKDLTPEQVRKFPFVQSEKKYCELCFEDNGMGIEPSQLEKIFDI